MTDLAGLAARLDQAARSAEPVAQLTATVELDVPAAYRVQAALVDLRIARGERLVGLKMGLTSRAKMAQMGVAEAIWGRLTDAMRIADQGTVDRAGFVHPRAEPEVVFRLDRAGSPTAVAAALDVIDSRYADFRFTLPDVIADNASAAALVVGPWRDIPSGVDNLGVLLEVDGRVAQAGSTLTSPRTSDRCRVSCLVPQHEAWPGVGSGAGCRATRPGGFAYAGTGGRLGPSRR